MLPIVVNAFFVIFPEFVQFLRRVLRRINTQNNWESRVAAVQRTDAPHKGVIQFLVFCVTVLPALNRLVVGGTGRVSGYLPAVTAEIIVVLLTDLLLHQSQAAHNATPDSGFHGGMNAGFIVDCDNPIFCQIPGSLPDGGGIILRPRRNLRKGEIASLSVSVCKPHSLAIRHDCPHLSG